jgi:SAM-dependent methyltransferase
MVHPRAEDPWQTLRYYDTEDEVYYTHAAPRRGRAGHASLPFLARLLRRLAWMGDRGTELSEEEIDRLCPRRPAAILDIGCGPGQLLAKCRDLGHAVEGVEPDPVARDLAMAQGLVVHAGTGEALPEPVQAQTFDIVVVSHVLHHCVDPVGALRNLADRLAPGGRLICEVPNQTCLGAIWAGLAWGHLDVPRQLNVFTPQSLGRMIEQSSLRIEAVRWAQYCRQFLPATIENERRKFDFFKARGSPRASLPVKPGLLSRYALLARTLFVQDIHKYDSIRIIACKSGTSDGSA